jgi:hypothetical protein
MSMWLGAPALKMQMTRLAPVPFGLVSADRVLPGHQAVTMAGADFNQPRRDGVMWMTSERVGFGDSFKEGQQNLTRTSHRVKKEVIHGSASRIHSRWRMRFR